MQRRQFLKLGALLPLIYANPVAALQGHTRTLGGKILILLELKGGNDGLNTVIPYNDAQYSLLRPNLSLPREQVIPLNEQLGLHTSLEPLKKSLWDQRELAIILGVGYPEPNRSHFRSIEIWDTASGSKSVMNQGWISQALGPQYIDGNAFAHGLVLGTNPGPLGAQARTIVMHNSKQFLRQANRMQLIPDDGNNAALSHILQTQNNIYQSAKTLQQRLQTVPEISANFSKSRLGRQLGIIAQMLAANIYVPVIKIAHGGFDTHSNQKNRHKKLLADMAHSLTEFRAVMQQHKLWDRIVLMTYSEFGRRVRENASRGTDHGTASVHFVLGGKIRGGLYGKQPSLTHLHNNDLIYQVDYRSLYSTIAEKWWHLPRVYFNGKRFPTLGFLS